MAETTFPHGVKEIPSDASFPITDLQPNEGGFIRPGDVNNDWGNIHPKAVVAGSGYKEHTQPVWKVDEELLTKDSDGVYAPNLD